MEAELRFGAAHSPQPIRTLAPIEALLGTITVLPFDSASAKIYGQIRAMLRQAGTMIGANDLLIASITLANDLILVTHNVSEFSRVPGLKIEDWEAP